MVEPLLDSTRLRFVKLEEKQRQFEEILYRAYSWDLSRRFIVKVVARISRLHQYLALSRLSTGTIVCSQSIYEHYTNRWAGASPSIKAVKCHLSMDRLSCHRYHLPISFDSSCMPIAFPDVRVPPRLSSRNSLAQARNRNLTSSGPQDRGPYPRNHSTHLGPSFLCLSRTTPLIILDLSRKKSSDAGHSLSRNGFRHSSRPSFCQNGSLPQPLQPPHEPILYRIIRLSHLPASDWCHFSRLFSTPD